MLVQPVEKIIMHFWADKKWMEPEPKWRYQLWRQCWNVSILVNLAAEDRNLNRNPYEKCIVPCWNMEEGEILLWDTTINVGRWSWCQIDIGISRICAWGTFLFGFYSRSDPIHALPCHFLTHVSVQWQNFSPSGLAFWRQKSIKVHHLSLLPVFKHATWFH